jgi:hypothetical protein
VLNCTCEYYISISASILTFSLHIHQKGNNLGSENQATGSHAQHTPTGWDNIKVFGEVSFSHTITRPANGRSVGDFLGTIVKGRVDHGIGHVIPYSTKANKPRRRFHTLLLVIEAKTARNLTCALPQLVVYLASIHQSRLQQERSDATVYGVASDGYSFIFVTITHSGVVKQSRRFELAQGEIQTILGCLKYILEKSASMSPNSSPESQRDGGEMDQMVDSGSDAEMDIDGSGYISPPEGS